MRRQALRVAATFWAAFYGTLSQGWAASTCLDSQWADHLISYYHVDEKAIIPGDSTRETELCNRESRLSLLLETLDSLNRAEFKTASGGWVREHYADYVTHFSPSISFDQDGACGSSIALACHQLTTAPLLLTDLFFSYPGMTPLNRIGTLIHESRHGEGYTHVACTRGPIHDQGLDGPYCDPSLGYGGSYAAEIEFYSRVALTGTSFHPTDVAYARRKALLILDTFINEPPRFETQEQIILKQNDTGDILSFDGEKLSKAQGLSWGNEVMTELPVSDHAMLLDSKTSTSRVLDLSEGISPRSVWDAETSSEYLRSNFGFTNPYLFEAPPILDFLYEQSTWIQLYSFGVFPQHFEVGKSASFEEIPTAGKNFDSGWEGLRLSRFSPSGRRGLFIVSSNSKNHNLRLQELVLEKNKDGIQEGRVIDAHEEWPQTLVKIVALKGKTYQLISDGSVLRKEPDGTFSPVPALSGIAVSDLKTFQFSSELTQIDQIPAGESK
jgi:hypothetical protein